jgi:hypothetical protein
MGSTDQSQSAIVRGVASPIVMGPSSPTSAHTLYGAMFCPSNVWVTIENLVPIQCDVRISGRVLMVTRPIVADVDQ